MVMLQTKVRQDALTRARWRADWPGCDKDAGDFSSLRSSVVERCVMFCCEQPTSSVLLLFSPTCRRWACMRETVQIGELVDALCSCCKFRKGGGSASDTHTEPVYML
jgi:hypothetical protein